MFTDFTVKKVAWHNLLLATANKLVIITNQHICIKIYMYLHTFICRHFCSCFKSTSYNVKSCSQYQYLYEVKVKMPKQCFCFPETSLSIYFNLNIAYQFSLKKRKETELSLLSLRITLSPKYNSHKTNYEPDQMLC